MNWTNAIMNSKPLQARTRAIVPIVLAALLAGGCASPSYTVTPQMQARAASENPAPAKDDDFPAPDSAKWRQGAFPSLEALRNMRTGMGKDQVRELLGFPHFSEGLGGAREWNYIFHFRTGAGPGYITCQYMVRFNDDVLTNGMYWKGPGCADLLRPPPAAAAPVVAVAPAAAPATKTTLGADGLFRFDGRTLADLLPEGRRKLDALAADIASSASVETVRVTGHTDRLGSDAYNQALSLARAGTVRDYLVQAGVPARKIQVQGRGSSEPKVQCARQAARAALIDCLAPNRRVEIEVSAGR
ncbi:outer membrane protein assembly factor BamE [Variovorax gossypii]|uniref:Outer membrane protein assembly factor BamE n=1 Tax=Variovorax gossypii TaxID=1679495 RepID=A0A431TDV5_9BURK|nr:OmpA family protein [Variovorax gossypii]RTQ31260.1 outer membrane protein assembly factor BamE [Variovorax gossypii]